MRPFLVTPPAGDVVKVDETLRRYCAVDGDTFWDRTLADNITAAVEHLEGYHGALGRCIRLQRWAFPVDALDNSVMLRWPDCRAFTVEKLTGQTWAAVAGVAITEHIERVDLEGLPADRIGISLNCDAGWATIAAIPESLKQAIRQLAAHWFLHREAVSDGFPAREVPMAAAMLLAPFRHVAV